MRKSKRIKVLENRIEEISAITEILVFLVNDIVKSKEKKNLDAGKWYKNNP